LADAISQRQARTIDKMSEYYHDFLSSMTGAGTIPATTPDEMQAPGFPASMAMNPALMASQYQNMGYFPGFQDSMMFNVPKAQKGRRKSGAGLGTGIDPVKHRRTRSGCFMCRSRRVKVSSISDCVIGNVFAKERLVRRNATCV
jgi:hypothetical protein